MLYFQKIIKDDQKMGEIIKILAPYITFNRFADTGTASNCQQRGEMNLGLIGETLFNQGDYEEAKKIFSSIIENEPNNEEANNNLGVIAYKRGDLQTAVICFFRALEKNPSYIDALENLAVIFNIPEHMPLFISCFEKIALKNNIALSQLLHSQTQEMSRSFLNLLLQSHSDSIRKIYWDLRALDIHRRWGNETNDYDMLRSIILSILPKRILDIGCGSGRLFPLYLEAGITEIIGQDVSSTALEICRQRFPKSTITLIEGVIEKLDYSSLYFDLLVSSRVLSAILPERIKSTVEFLCRISKKIYVNEMTESDFAGPSNYWFLHDYKRYFNNSGFEITSQGMMNKQTWYLFEMG